MKKICLRVILCSALFLSCLASCTTSMIAKAELALAPIAEPASSLPSKDLAKKPHEATPEKKEAPKFEPRVEISVPLKLAFGVNELKADIYRPTKRADPMTLVFLVPGSGEVSRRGEQSGDGVNNYEKSLELNAMWAEALLDKGYFVMSYDKRGSQKTAEHGIMSLASDLDSIFEFATDRLKNRTEPMRLVLMGYTQAAQTIALSLAAKKANAVVLLSPIAGSLESMWVDGLMKAQSHLNPSTKKTRLLNQAESTKAFFASLKKGQFPQSAVVRGATVKFWQSWIDASLNTPTLLHTLERPVLMLLSQNDVFSSGPVITQNQKIASSKTFTVKSLSGTDRNFIKNNKLADESVNEVLSFIGALKPLPKVAPAA